MSEDYKVHEVWIKEAETTILVIEIPKLELEDKLAYLAREKGNVPKSYYEDFIIAACVANVNQLIFHIKQTQPDVLKVREELITEIFKINPALKPDNLIINRNHVIKLKGRGKLKNDERLLSDNKHWTTNTYNDMMSQIEDQSTKLNESTKDKKEAPKICKLEDLEYSVIKQWWKRINKYIEIKKFKESDIASILNQRFFHNRSSFQTYVVSVCVIASEDLFMMLDSLGIPNNVPPPVLMLEVYELCREVNSFLTYENAQNFIEDLERDDAPINSRSPAPNRMTSHAHHNDIKKKKSKKTFKDVPKEDLLRLADMMKVFVIGQDMAVDSIVEAIQRASVGLKDPVKPIGSFLFAGRTGCGKCVEKGSLVFSEQGIKPIESFCSGNRLDELSVNVYGIQGVNKTSHIYKDGINKGRVIETDSGYRLGGSLVHPIVTITEDGKLVFKKFNELMVNDYVAIQYNQDYFSTTNAKLDFSFKKKVHDNHSVIYKVPKIMSSALAYYIGMLIGDGSLSTNNRIGFTSADKQLVSSFYTLSSSLFGVIPKLHSDKYGYYYSSTYIYNFLNNACKVSMSKSLDKEIPSTVLESSKECVSSFIKGLMDTDGYFEKCGAVGITLSSQRLINQLQTVFLNFGIVSSVRHRLMKYNDTFKDAWELKINGKFVRKYMKEIGFTLLRKTDSFNGFLNNYSYNPNKDVIPNIHVILQAIIKEYKFDRAFHKKYRGYYKGYRKPSRKKLNEILDTITSYVGYQVKDTFLFGYLNSLANSDIFWSKISEITEVAEMSLYDFTVPETHTFTSNGFISHNTLTTKVLANELIKDKNNLITVDCSEYSADHEYSKLIGCFVPGTKVLMEDGSRKSIENISVGDKVITHKGRARKVEHLHTYDQSGEMVSLLMASSDTPVITTKTHEILCIKHKHCDKGEKRAYRVCKPTCKQKYCVEPPYEDYKLGWLPASKLEKDDIVAYPRYKPTGKYPYQLDLANYIGDGVRYKFDDKFIWAQEQVKIPRFIPVNKDFMRLAGYYVSEGGAASCNKSINLTFHSKETNYMIEVVKYIRNLFGKEVRIRIQDRAPAKSCRVFISSKVIRNLMTTLFGKVVYEKKIPGWFKDMPVELVRNFLETALFGDGCLVTKRRADYSTVSLTLHSQMELLFRRLGYITHSHKEDGNKIGPNNKDRYRLYVSGSQVERLSKDFNFQIPFSDLPKTNIQRKAWVDDDYVYYQLKEVKSYDYTGKVYDLAVEDDTSYVLDFIVHNSPNGYIGYEQGGYLTNAINENPFSVVVFDEVEKASSKVHELLLQILEEGRLTDGKGQRVSFKDAVVILTSNIGVKEVESIKKTVGFGNVAELTEEKKTKAIDKAIKKKFKPEFLNRIDSIVHFNTLNADDYKKIIDIELYKLNDNLKHNDTAFKTLTLDFDKKIKNHIFKNGIDEDYGARPLKRFIEKEIATPLASRLLKEDINPSSIVKISIRNKKVIFEVTEPVDESKEKELQNFFSVK